MGWEQAERHEHYDAAGNLTGWTVVTREPEWDAEQRSRLLALRLHNAQVCACGFHESVIDQDLAVEPNVRVCPVCAGIQRHGRKLAADNEAADKALGKDLKPEVARAGDGQHRTLRILPPEERARREQAAAPTPRTPQRRSP